MESKNNNQKPGSKPPSKADLLSSAQLVAEAAKSTLRHDTGKVDKGKAAGAAANILHSASHYGKLEEKSFGKYIQKAEGYLHQYESSHSTATAGPTTNPTKPTEHSSYEHTTSSKPHSSSQHETSAPHDSDKKKKKEKEESKGGMGDYIKLAQGFIGKQSGGHSGGDHSSGATGAGDYIKLAQGFLGKQGGDHSSGSSGAGDYIKLAQGFMKKH